ncbi:MAG TPA: ABC transporter ATP-binding protein [Methanobacteriales archaeon]|nr:ABC transporter ATP-binding protein [Methanobacteriaceae archaeon]HIH62480.1 ABC transporter ATP-binding protein [Methanobacteriales archaeon]
MIDIKNLKKTFDDGKIVALDGIDLQVDEGEFISIMGPSGSGKSTLLNMIGALDRPDSGMIKVAGRNLMKEKDLSSFRAQEIGFIFQLHNLIPNLTVLENVEIPMFEGPYKDSMDERAMELLEYLGLAEKSNRLPSELSGGERQRVAIARALANDPTIILADEPTGSLDSKTEKKILEKLKELNREHNVTIVLVTHDPRVASMASRIIKILDGKIVGG